jgi:putative transposase
MVSALTLDVPTPPAEPADGGTLGVDLGIVQLATDSDGETFSGAAIEQIRQRMGALRAARQTRGTTSAKRHLKRLSGQEARFRRATNHCTSKHLVAKAKHRHRRIALEDLRHIRSRTGNYLWYHETEQNAIESRCATCPETQKSAHKQQGITRGA